LLFLRGFFRLNDVRDHQGYDDDKRDAQQPKNDRHKGLHCYRSARINQINNISARPLFQVFRRDHELIACVTNWNQFTHRVVLNPDDNAKGMCHADSHLDCDRRLHIGDVGRPLCASESEDSRDHPVYRDGREGTDRIRI
jgi:hypothetical protein